MAVLDILTIDGVSMNIHSAYSWSVNKTVTFPVANTDVVGATVTVTEPGVYAISGTMAFGVGASTGATQHTIKVSNKTTGSYSAIRAINTVDASNGQVTKTVTGFIKKTDTEPRSLAVIGNMGKTTSSNTNSYLSVTKLIDLGGVVRHLKNVAVSMLDRPFIFRKAVA